MSPEQQAEIQDRTAAVAGLAATVGTAFAMRAVYEEMGGYDSEAEGACQTAHSALNRIQEHVEALRGMCKERTQCEG